MGIVKRVKSELRSSLENPATPLAFGTDWLVNGIGMGNRTASGQRVNEITAMNIPAVWACVKRISEDVASLPLNIYEKLQPRGNRVADELDLFDLLYSAPNREMTSYTWRETSQAHVLLWGNLYTEIQRDKGNRVVALWPRHPSKTKPVRNSAGEIEYKTTDGMSGGQQRTIAAVDMLHVPGLGWDGLIGMSVVHMAAQSMGLSLATESFGAKFFGNGAQPGGALTVPAGAEVDDIARNNMKKSWQEAHGGDRQGSVALLEGGVTYSAIGIPPDASQFLETRQFQVAEIARWFAMPLHMLADLSRAQHSNIEQQAIEYVQSCLRPWLVRWEQELVRKLFPSGKPAEKSLVGRHANKKYFPAFDFDGLIRGDYETRWKGYAIALQNGVACPNVIAEKENMNPIAKEDAGDAYRVPLNLVPADRWLAGEPDVITPDGSAQPTKDDGAEVKALLTALAAERRDNDARMLVERRDNDARLAVERRDHETTLEQVRAAERLALDERFENERNTNDATIAAKLALEKQAIRREIDTRFSAEKLASDNRFEAALKKSRAASDEKLSVLNSELEKKFSAALIERAESRSPANISTVYSRLFRDAFDRSLRKDKADSLVLYRTLAPVLLSISEGLATQVATEMRLDAQPNDAIAECVRDYVTRMTKRAAVWSAETADVTAPDELQRAVKAITAFIYRESATQKSKELQAVKPKEEKQ